MSSSNRRTRHIALALCAFAALIPNASAQDLEFSVSSSPVGSGARAAGMADAFVAIADDATAASWNPAGLIQLEEPEISAVWSFNGVRDNFHPSPGHPEVPPATTSTTKSSTSSAPSTHSPS
jgi:long-subunit fatty acid transport protein